MNNIEKISTVIAVGTLGLTAHSVINNQVNAATVTSMKTTANLNVRTGPGTNYPSVGLLAKGTTVKVLSIRNNWARLNTGKYVSSLYLKNAKSTTSRQTYKKGQVLNRLVIVNKSNLTLSYYNNGVLINSFKCAIGKPSTPTPSGKFSVINKVPNRPYYKKGIPGGAPNNPLGTRFIQLTTSGYAIHGTCYPNSIGKQVSDGCVRLNNQIVNWLYNRVSIGTVVLIDYGTNKNIANKYGVIIYY